MQVYPFIYGHIDTQKWSLVSVNTAAWMRPQAARIRPRRPQSWAPRLRMEVAGAASRPRVGAVRSSREEAPATTGHGRRRGCQPRAAGEGKGRKEDRRGGGERVLRGRHRRESERRGWGGGELRVEGEWRRVELVGVDYVNPNSQYI